MKVNISLSMAHDRRSAMYNIGAMKSPLSDVVFQLYLWGDTQTQSHWRKELRAIVKICKQNVRVKGGKLKKKDIVESLDNIAIQEVIEDDYKSMLKDPDYSSLKTLREGAMSHKQFQHLIETLAAKVLITGSDDWEIADNLIDIIQTW